MFKPMCRRKTCILSVLLCAAVLLSFCAAGAQAKWAPAEGPLLTKWAKDVSPNKGPGIKKQPIPSKVLLHKD